MHNPSRPYLSLFVLTLAAGCSSADPTATGSAGTGSSDPTTLGSTGQASTDPAGVTTSGETPTTDNSMGGTGTISASGTGESGGIRDLGGTFGTTTGDGMTGLTSDTETDTTTGDPPAACGDGKVDEGEACDLGAANADDGACTLGCQAAVCGDGLVQSELETCDDANQADDDLCVAGCKVAACGDGFVGPGEACDDGNQVDDDACGNDCSPPNCGDGKVQQNQGETCDDGNQVETDACLTTCVKASCGDGQVHDGVELCDDGNPDETDVCTSLCAAPSCADKIESGGETDIDCGGPDCVDCKLGGSCVADTDCETGACEAGQCALPQRCKQIKGALPASKDGIYTIDADGMGSGEPFEVWCDMTVDGGGWTSLVHLTDLAGLNYSLAHTQVAVSESTKFWILAEKANPTYQVFTYNGLPNTNYQALGPAPTDTGWLWNDAPWNNPGGCHEVQQLVLVQAENLPPRSYGNPHYNPGQSFNAALTPVALTTASTIGVAPVKNFPSIHIGCVGWNVLKDPIVWVR